MQTTPFDKFPSAAKDRSKMKTGALIFVEDGVSVAQSIDHHVKLGFDFIFIFGSAELAPKNLAPNCLWVGCEISSNSKVIDIINDAISYLPNTWLYYCFNTEYLYFPFSETRKINDFVGFLEEEKRISAFGAIVDLYPPSISSTADNFSPESALFDTLGYFSQTRQDAFGPKNRQIDVYGGLRWRFEEHIPWNRRRINSAFLFKAKLNLRLDSDFIFNDSNYETYQSEWHNSPTVAVCSFRAAKFLSENPGSKDIIERFDWPNSAEFKNSAAQLLEHGLMEPGQWF